MNIAELTVEEIAEYIAQLSAQGKTDEVKEIMSEYKKLHAGETEEDFEKTKPEEPDFEKTEPEEPDFEKTKPEEPDFEKAEPEVGKAEPEVGKAEPEEVKAPVKRVRRKNRKTEEDVEVDRAKDECVRLFNAYFKAAAEVKKVKRRLDLAEEEFLEKTENEDPLEDKAELEKAGQRYLELSDSKRGLLIERKLAWNAYYNAQLEFEQLNEDYE